MLILASDLVQFKANALLTHSGEQRSNFEGRSFHIDFEIHAGEFHVHEMVIWKIHSYEMIYPKRRREELYEYNHTWYALSFLVFEA